MWERIGLLNKIDDIYRLLASKKFALYLFIGLSIVLVPKTFVSQPITYLDWTMRVVLGLLLVNLLLCTIQRFKALRKATLLIHIGTIVTIAGGLISGLGYVATINIHEGSTVDTVFRWDIEKDINLGFDLKIKEIKREFYPIPVKVGVLNKGEKDSLQMVKTGESFQWKEFKVLVDSLDFEQQELFLKVFVGIISLSRHPIPNFSIHRMISTPTINANPFDLLVDTPFGKTFVWPRNSPVGTLIF